ncbi:MAG TPA: heme-binding protein [Croceibacterium sp.]|nr:heme-binding protein [Croceibacterium sp.]
MRKGFALVVALLLAVPAAAQTQRPMLDYATAAAMRDACVAYARAHQTSVAIAIYNDEGRLVTYDVMDGVVNVAGELAQWKGKAAAGYRVSTADMAKWGGGGVPGVATLPGGVPFFTANGAALGAIGVSGGSQGADLPCAQAAVAAAGLRQTAN